MTIEELTKKAKAGDAAAQVDLGWCYETGDGVTTDYKKAAELYEKAANRGFAAGERMFGACCYTVRPSEGVFAVPFGGAEGRRAGAEICGYLLF